MGVSLGRGVGVGRHKTTGMEMHAFRGHAHSMEMHIPWKCTFPGKHIPCECNVPSKQT